MHTPLIRLPNMNIKITDVVIDMDHIVHYADNYLMSGRNSTFLKSVAGKSDLDKKILYLEEYLVRVERCFPDADSLRLFLSAPRETYFRRAENPDYKANRKSEYSEDYLALKHFLKEYYYAGEKEGFEADDLCGQYITQKLGLGTKGGTVASLTDTVRWSYSADRMPILLSRDKDMDTIPGLHGWVSRRPYSVKLSTKYITIKQSVYNYMYQALVGDSADNLKGCPGIGPVKAKKVLDGAKDYLTAYIDCFIKVGLTQADAIAALRQTYITRYRDTPPFVSKPGWSFKAYETQLHQIKERQSTLDKEYV